MLPLISIIIPTYNGSKFILETLESCRKQTYSNIEIIVVNDGSIDNTKELLSTYNDIVYIDNKINLGIPLSVNNGVDKSSGEYFILLGHDDILGADHVAKIFSEFEEDTVAVHCNSIIINEKAKELKKSKNDIKQFKKTENALYNLSINCFIQSCGMMHKKKIFNLVGGWDPKYKLYGEWLYYIKMLRYGKLKYSTASTAYYRKHDTNITKSFTNKMGYIELESYKNICRSLAHYENKNSLLESFNYYIKRIKFYIRLKLLEFR
jgi:glycosyltransferase involved in cell wall biosynthesis